jgi:hypothetical protein
MIGGRYAPWPCWSGFVPVVPGTGVPGDSPVWTRSHIELSHADHWAARRRSQAVAAEGTACSGPAGLSTKADSTGGCVGLGLREAVHRSNHLGGLMQISHRRCVEPRHSNRPGKPEVLPGREQSGLARQMMAAARAQNEGLTWTPRGSTKFIAAPYTPGRNTPVAEISSPRGFDVAEVAEHTN